MKSNLSIEPKANLKLAKMKKKIFMLVIAIACASFSHAQIPTTCEGFGTVLQTTWQSLYSVSHPIGQAALVYIPVVGQNQEAVDAISEASEDFHSFVFNENSQSWLTFGPRTIPVLKTRTTQYGTLRKIGVGGVRVFTTSGMLWDRVEITIEKRGGRAKTGVGICTENMVTGDKNHVDGHEFPNGNNTSSKTFTIKNVYGKSISVKLKNRSATNKFEYTIKTKGFLNIKKQKARAYKNRGIKEIKPVSGVRRD